VSNKKGLKYGRQSLKEFDPGPFKVPQNDKVIFFFIWQAIDYGQLFLQQTVFILTLFARLLYH